MTADTIAAPRSPRTPARKSGPNLEKWGWIYMRVSGVALIILIFGHLFVNLALIHGANGMRTIVNDYVTHETTRRVLVWALWLSAGFLIVLGTLVVFTFDPCLGIESSSTDWLIETCAAL